MTTVVDFRPLYDQANAMRPNVMRFEVTHDTTSVIISSVESLVKYPHILALAQMLGINGTNGLSVKDTAERVWWQMERRWMEQRTIDEPPGVPSATIRVQVRDSAGNRLSDAQMVIQPVDSLKFMNLQRFIAPDGTIYEVETNYYPQRTN